MKQKKQNDMNKTIFTIYASTNKNPNFLIGHKVNKFITEDQNEAEQVFKKQVDFFSSYQPLFNIPLCRDKVYVHMDTASGPSSFRMSSSEYKEFNLTERLKLILTQSGINEID